MPSSLRLHGLYGPWNSPDQNTGVGSLSLLQGIFPNQGLNPSLLNCMQILYQLSQKGSPRILEWVAYPFSRGSSQPRNRTGVSCVADKLFTNWGMREVPRKNVMPELNLEEWKVLARQSKYCWNKDGTTEYLLGNYKWLTLAGLDIQGIGLGEREGGVDE